MPGDAARREIKRPGFSRPLFCLDRYHRPIDWASTVWWRMRIATAKSDSF